MAKCLHKALSPSRFAFFVSRSPDFLLPFPDREDREEREEEEDDDRDREEAAAEVLRDRLPLFLWRLEERLEPCEPLRDRLPPFPFLPLPFFPLPCPCPWETKQPRRNGEMTIDCDYHPCVLFLDFFDFLGLPSFLDLSLFLSLLERSPFFDLPGPAPLAIAGVAVLLGLVLDAPGSNTNSGIGF